MTVNSKCQAFSENVILITGAGAGQGAREAIRFAREGAMVIVSDVDKEKAERVAEFIHRENGIALPYVLNVVEQAQWTELVDTLRRKYGVLHALINNAGIIARKRCIDITLDYWHRVMEVNVTGVMLGVQACAPLIRDSGGGAIVNVSSVTGLLGHHEPSYTASKWAVRGLTKSQALEYVDWGIRVNSIHPAMVEETSFSELAVPSFREITKKFIPMGRLGELDEIADLVLFLCGSQSTFITGAEIAIDGGYTAGAITRIRKMMSENRL